jgi:hypothetical protein
MECLKAIDEQLYFLLRLQDCASEMPCARYLQIINIERNIILEYQHGGKGNVLQGHALNLHRPDSLDKDLNPKDLVSSVIK